MTLRQIVGSTLLPLVLLSVGCQSSTTDDWPADNPGPKIVTSFAPITVFAMNVAGPDATVRPLMTTQGPHHYEPAPNDARRLTRADIFFINGLELDNSIAKKMQQSAGNSKLKIVPLGTRLPETLLLEGGCGCNHGDAKDDKGHKHDHDHDHADHDPHTWMGLPQAIKYVEIIRDELKALDPAHAAGYESRAAAYIVKLNALRTEGQELLKDKKIKRFISFHESLNYFAQTYDLTIGGAIEETPGHEPTPKQLTELLDICKKKQIHVLAVEPQYSSKSAAATVLSEMKRNGIADAVMISVDPMETATEAELTADWYETTIRKNLKALAGALK
ncbi:MAG: metal ABC transporter substrate-binding protein [Gemmataceae bacterium]